LTACSEEESSRRTRKKGRGRRKFACKADPQPCLVNSGAGDPGIDCRHPTPIQNLVLYALLTFPSFHQQQRNFVRARYSTFRVLLLGPASFIDCSIDGKRVSFSLSTANRKLRPAYNLYSLTVCFLQSLCLLPTTCFNSSTSGTIGQIDRSIEWKRVQPLCLLPTISFNSRPSHFVGFRSSLTVNSFHAELSRTLFKCAIYIRTMILKSNREVFKYIRKFHGS
jgi:hypothetical protein